MSRYPHLPEDLKQSLRRIEPSRRRHIDYYPCLVTLRSGRTVDRVYIQEELSFKTVWGFYLEERSQASWIDIREVASVSDSPSRLPASLATELYQMGETGMGGHEFTVEFSDGTSEFYTGGNAIDFIDYPPGKSQKDVVDARNRGRLILGVSIPDRWRNSAQCEIRNSLKSS
jgi:hypothetical protein